MDSPISNIGVHPYGRRRTGTKEYAGVDAQFERIVCALQLIGAQRYKLN